MYTANTMLIDCTKLQKLLYTIGQTFFQHICWLSFRKKKAFTESSTLNRVNDHIFCLQFINSFIHIVICFLMLLLLVFNKVFLIVLNVTDVGLIKLISLFHNTCIICFKCVTCTTYHQ